MEEKKKKMRTKVQCCSHTTPKGESYVNKEFQRKKFLEKKLENLTITPEEMVELATFRAAEKHFAVRYTRVEISVFGDRVILTIEEYEKRGKGFPILRRL